MVHSLHYKSLTELSAQSVWGNKYVKQLGVKQQWRLLPFSYSLYLRHRCTIGNHHKGRITHRSRVLFLLQKISWQTNTNTHTHTHQPPLEDQSSQLLANEQITNQFGEQTLVRTGAFSGGQGSGGRRGKWEGGTMRQMANIQGSKQMNICLFYSQNNDTMFPGHRLGPGQASGTVHRQERTLSVSLFLMAGWVEEDEEEEGKGGTRRIKFRPKLSSCVAVYREFLSPHKPLYLSTLPFTSQLCSHYERN